MFGKNAARRAEEEARRAREEAAESRRRADEQQALANRQIVKAEAPKPIETEQDRQNLAWIKMFDNKQDKDEAPPDITKAPGFGLQLAAYNADTAEQGYNDMQQGQGLLSMGSNASTSPELTSQIRDLRHTRQRQLAGLNLQRAAAAKDAEVRGSIMPMLAFQQNRDMGLASLLSGNALGQQSNALGWSNNALSQAQLAAQARARSGFGQTPFGNAFLTTAGRFLGGGGSGFTMPRLG